MSVRARVGWECGGEPGVRRLWGCGGKCGGEGHVRVWIGQG